MTNGTPQGRILWCDAAANCRRLSTREGVEDIIEKASRARINTVVVDVKPLAGEVLYKSKLAPRLGVVEGFQFPPDFDLLAVMIEEGHKRNIRVHAGINVFAEGNREWGRGPAFQHPDWQAVMYESVRTLDFSVGLSVQVESVDPWWIRPDETYLHTRKFGEHVKTESGRTYIVIVGNVVLKTWEGSHVDRFPIPNNVCILDIPGSVSVEVGEEVVFRAEGTFRKAEDSKTPSWGVFVNPIGPARAYELQIMEEIVSGYDIDGIIFDRMRYPNLYADFGEISRESFEKWLGTGDVKWPDDIYGINAFPWLPPVPGKYYREWLEWRAWQIRQFADQAVSTVRSIKREVKVGVYVGSWYDSYYDVGVNWGSKDFHAEYPWMTPEYNRTGFAELFDYICTGCYYPHVAREEADAAGKPEGASVEAACELSNRAIAGASLNYGSIYLRDYADNPDGFKKAMETVLALSKGIMLFDLVYLEEYGWWPILEGLFAEEAVSPHDV